MANFFLKDFQIKAYLWSSNLLSLSNFQIKAYLWSSNLLSLSKDQKRLRSHANGPDQKTARSSGPRKRSLVRRYFPTNRPLEKSVPSSSHPSFIVPPRLPPPRSDPLPDRSLTKMSAFSAAKILSPPPFVAQFAAEKSLCPFLSSPSALALTRSPLRSTRLPRTPLAVSSDVVVGHKSLACNSSTSHNEDVGREAALVLYEDMVLGRVFEDMCAQMYYRGKMFGFVHLYNGQEAVSTGFIKLLEARDSVVSTYRDHVHALSKGVAARSVMAELFGKATGCCRGQGGSMHMFSSTHNLLGGFAFIGEGIPVATGAAFSSKYRHEVLKESNPNGLDVTVAFFGDGTCNNGQFFECLNMAQLWKLPIVFVVENNLWAIGMSHIRATSDPEIWKKGPAFGMPGYHVDGMDVLKVREVAMEAIARARRGDGPSLVECETYRFRGHSLADPDELRKPGELQSLILCVPSVLVLFFFFVIFEHKHSLKIILALVWNSKDDMITIITTNKILF